ncbi:flagellar biosynthetic protein FlhB [Anaerocolumna cellulosilytica]|uniref:Flagellar biosynthetic protein FlhB n=1 Tax=Anaerocolumna cellulosilytica TaxID=433286 RepID=A0A6S6R1L5_9FIRM|nr:flagellar biosynthesis protein FlhB [Anaerocolumna cellulosilytica]MBB5197015.1 flagellar biosynthetic protein FlhB [Anaerocolumna cellulosilytica]BCJ95229.1 flagellar biosynthetic protein FlhB [Anaerocolumna cellulosilytica]
MERLLKYELQFFAEGSGGEKTEEPTAKKLTDARQEGQVAKSTDLVTAAALFTLFVTLKVFVGTIGKGFLGAFYEFYNNIEKIAGEEFNINTSRALMQEGLLSILKILIPVLIASFFTVVAINLFQVKWKPTAKPLQPKFSKFNPISGMKKIFSKDKVVDLFKELIKIGAILTIAYNTLKNQSAMLLKLYDMELMQAIIFIGNIVIGLGINISIVFLILGLADYLYQKFKFKKDMRMTKQEIKDEYKQSEGDPQIKGKIKAKMREVSQRRMMQSLPEADVVITNPTHFAAAIKYDREKSDAPILLAKGADYLAQKIKEAARENKIHIVENKPLARMLYYNVEIGNEIPPELYQMTAEVLAYVYNLNK